MNNVFSKNQKIEIVISILVFLVSLNIFHIGQLILPLICLIQFIDRGFKFRVNNLYIFILLCLFGLSFYLFTTNLGFYRYMGFTLAFVYYIGSNLIKYDENTFKKVLLIIISGMTAHCLLNMCLDFSYYGFALFLKRYHYDIFVGVQVSTTGLATNCLLSLASSYYLFIHEKNKNYKIIGLLCLFICFLYTIALGRRTTTIAFIICFLTSFIFDFLIFKNKYYPKIKKIFFIALILIFVSFIVVYFNLFNIKDLLVEITLIEKFIQDGLKTERLEIFMAGIKLMPLYLWGGQKISGEIGVAVHDLLIDTYDCAGIITFSILLILVFYYLYVVYRSIKVSGLSKQTKVLVISIELMIIILMCIEPVMTGSSLFLICSIFITTVLEGIICQLPIT